MPKKKLHTAILKSYDQFYEKQTSQMYFLIDANIILNSSEKFLFWNMSITNTKLTKYCPKKSKILLSSRFCSLGNSIVIRMKIHFGKKKITIKIASPTVENRTFFNALCLRFFMSTSALVTCTFFWISAICLTTSTFRTSTTKHGTIELK